MAVLGTAVIDFGSTPVNEASFNITNGSLTALMVNEEAYVMVEATGSNDAQAHREAGAFMRLVCEPPSAGAMVVNAYILNGLVTGTFNVRYVAAEA